MSENSRASKWARTIILTFLVSVFVGSEASQAQTERKITKLADGVYVIEHRDANDGYASGNSTVIIGDRQVFVVDACFLPSAAREDIAQIRQWTDKPVAFVLNTHFHNDHNLGNRVYMDAFPALTIIAQSETKKDMDMFGPGSADRERKGMASLQKMLDKEKTSSGHVLTPEETAEVRTVLERRKAAFAEIEAVRFQSATMTFTDGLTVDLGNREVQVKFLGRGNTSGDAVAYLPKEKIVVAGDLVVYPVPYIYDGYPAEWAETLQKLAALDAKAIVPGHGPVLRDRVYLGLCRELLLSAVEQMNAKLRQTGPAMFQSLDDVKAGVDLSPFKERFAGGDKKLEAQFDEMAANLVKVAFTEASLR